MGRIRNRAVRIEARHEKSVAPALSQLRVPQQRDHNPTVAGVYARRVVLVLAGVVGTAAETTITILP